MNFADLRKKELWPLRTRRAGGGGYKIIGLLNAAGYLEDGTTDVDSITMVISSPFSDYASSAAKLAFFRLFPCERLTIALELEEKFLLNRPESPCRDEVSPINKLCRGIGGKFLLNRPESQ